MKEKINTIINSFLCVLSIITIGVGCGALTFFVSLISTQFAIVVLFLVAIAMTYTICNIIK